MENTIKPGNFPIGSPQSRAAARLRLEHMNDDRERIQLISFVPRPNQDNTRPHATPWHECDDGRLFRVLYVPHGMEDSEARRIVAAGGSEG